MPMAIARLISVLAQAHAPAYIHAPFYKDRSYNSRCLWVTSEVILVLMCAARRWRGRSRKVEATSANYSNHWREGGPERVSGVSAGPPRPSRGHLLRQEVCITRLMKAKKRCPTCNAWKFTSEPDDKLRATLDEVRVRCGNGRAGCQWEGRLRDLDAHFNLSPTLSDSGCEFAGTECYKRLYILEHESQNCLKRPHTCSECQLKGTYDTITKVHWFECQRNALNAKLDALQKGNSRSGWCGSPWLLAFLVAVGAVTIAAVLSDPSSGSDEFTGRQLAKQ